MTDLGENLPIDMEGRDSLVGKFDSVEDLAKSYHSLSKKMGETTRVPSSDADKSEWSGFYQSLGAPSEEDGYVIPETASEEFSGTLKSMRKSALERGLTKEQWGDMVSPMVNLENERSQSQDKLQQESVDKWKQSARERYGKNYESQSALAERAYNNVVRGNPELDKVFSATGMGYHPEVMDFMVRMGANMSDESTPSGASGSSFGTDYRNLAARARKLAKIGAISNPKNPDYEEHFSEFMQIQRDLAEGGYQGMSDKRLMPEQSWISGAGR
tara:strand:- start:2781 stop:3596 length:816 start_codon:yes stop_codon:yes gene_type:complete